MFTGTSMLLTVNEHNMRVERALGECRKEYNILFDAIINSQKGNIATKQRNTSSNNESQADIPSELSLPVPMSATYQSLIVNMTDRLFIRSNFCVYVIRLTLTNHINYNLYHVLPLPIKIKGTDTRFTPIWISKRSINGKCFLYITK
jgi:hypothetical protein